MEPILSHAADKAPHNAPRDLLSRLYREIGISAVAAALHASDDGGRRAQARRETARETAAKKTAA